MVDERARDERARDGLVHLQAAALELIAAARAFLDVAEDLAREPGALTAITETIGDVAAAVVRAAAAPAGGPRPGGEPADGVDDDEHAAGVTRIRLS